MNYSVQALADAFNVEDLPSGQQAIAEVIGKEATLKLCAAFGGESLYIPRNDALESCKCARDIHEQYYGQGRSVRELARLYGVSQRHVQRIIGKKFEDLKVKNNGKPTYQNP